jgi:nitrate/nitrite-specific signal transduction histidine kinase
MRERASILKGDLVIEAVPAGGTRIRVRVPLAPPVADTQLVAEPV